MDIEVFLWGKYFFGRKWKYIRTLCKINCNITKLNQYVSESNKNILHKNLIKNTFKTCGECQFKSSNSL
jgi:hypothetical protein